MLEIFPSGLRFYLFVCVGVISASLLLRWSRWMQADRALWTRAWILLTTAVFFGGHFVVVALALVLVVAWLAKRMPDDIPALYTVLLPIMPPYSFIVPGAFGINQILGLSFGRVLALLMIPAYLAAQRTELRDKLFRNAIDFCFVLYCFWQVILAFVQRPSITDSIRTALEVLLFMLLPYLVISRMIRNWAQMRRVLLALAFTGVMVAGIGMVEQRMTQHFYLDVPINLNMQEQAGFVRAHDVRGGLLRIRGTSDISTGEIYCIALAIVLLFWRLGEIRGVRMAAIAGLLALATFFTGSRGALIMLALVMGVMWIFPMLKSPGRFVFWTLVAIPLASVAQDYFLSTTDQYGTFNYRADLFRASVPLIWERPWFGWGTILDLFASGRLDHMRQGQGIIDLVNTYLYEGLLRGIPGFLLYSGTFLFTVLSVLRKLGQPGVAAEAWRGPVAAMLVGCTLGMAFYVSSISPVGFITDHILWLAALASAYVVMPVEAARA